MLGEQVKVEVVVVSHVDTERETDRQTDRQTERGKALLV